jgi:hypothetical protein
MPAALTTRAAALRIEAGIAAPDAPIGSGRAIGLMDMIVSSRSVNWPAF